MRTIKHTCKIYASLEDVWQTLVEPKEITKWGGGPAVMDDKEGTKFTLWGGQVHGTNLKVIPMKKIVQEWYGGDWENPSTVTFTLRKKGNMTYLDVLHTDVPDEEYKEFLVGWVDFYLEPLKKIAEKHYKWD